MNESNAMALANEAMGAVDWDALHARSRAVFDAVHRGSSLALQSGLFGAPPERPEMTRALPDYASRDPNELAMMRHREMVRPQAGRADFPIEHVANMATAAAAFSPAGAVLAPEYLAGRAIAAGAQYAPKLATAALAAGGAMSPSMAGGAENQQAALPKDPQAIREIQTKLRDAGYPVAVDGIMRPGGETERAFRQFQADEATRRAEEIKRQELQTQQGANAATLETARANQATAAAKLEADRLKGEKDAADLERKRLGDERMREIESNISPTSRLIRDYSGPAGLVAGGVLGALSRFGLKSGNDAFSTARAAAGEEIMGQQIAGKGASANLSRVARINEFWRKGGGEVPFVLTPGSAPGYAVNPKASSLGSTYSPNVHPAVEATTTVLPAGESIWADYQKGQAQDELVKAMDDANTDPSEINIQRVQKAKDNVALYGGLSNMGRVWAGTNLVGAVGGRFMQSNPKLRPNMAPAEQEQLALQKVLRDAQERADKAAKKAAAQSILQQRANQLSGTPAPAFTGPNAYQTRQQP